MLTQLIAGFIGATIGISFWIVPDMLKHWKQKQRNKKIIEQKMLEAFIKEIVIKELSRLYNGEQQQRESNIVEKE